MEGERQPPARNPVEGRGTIDDTTLREIAADERIPVGTIEKDLALVCALHRLSISPLKRHLVFKGGTAIKMAYYPEARFSEDLDFTVQPPNRVDVIKTLHQVLSNVQIESINFHDIAEDRFSQEGRSLRLPFTGPLRFNNSIKIDLSFRDDLIHEKKEYPIQHRYGETLSTTFNILDFTELIAEKIRALMSRGYPRDYYDVWAHLDKIPDKNDLKELAKKKCLLANLSYTPDAIFEKDTLQRVKAEWDNQLKHLVRDPVSFDEIKPKLEQELAFLN